MLDRAFDIYDSYTESIIDSVFHSDNIVFLLSCSLNIIDCNVNARSLFRINRRKIIGTSIYDFLKSQSIDFPYVKWSINDLCLIKSYQTTIRRNNLDSSVNWRMVTLPSFTKDSRVLLVGEKIFDENSISDCDQKHLSIFSEVVGKKDFFLKNKILALAWIKQFVLSYPGQAHIKETRNLTYVVSNDLNSKILSTIKKSSIEGSSVKDLLLPIDYINQIQNMDAEVIENRSAIFNREGLPFLSSTQKLRKLKITKIPLIDENNDVKYILTFSVNSEIFKNPKLVRSVYYKLLKNRITAHQYFLNHFKLSKSLTERQLDCLISLIENHTTKEVAIDLGISDKAVEALIVKLKEVFKVYNKASLIKMGQAILLKGSDVQL